MPAKKNPPTNPFEGIGVQKKRGRKAGTMTAEVAGHLETLRNAVQGGKVVCVSNQKARPTGVAKTVQLVTIGKSMDTIAGYIARLQKEGTISNRQNIEGGVLVVK